MALLDVGCGLGSITLGLAEAVAPGRVVGIDLNEDAIVKAQASAEERGVVNLTFRVGNCYELPFEDSSFDAVFAHMVFMHLSDPGKAAAEAYRVLKPSGVFAVADRAEQGDLRGNSNPTIERAWEIFMQWHASRGSDLRFGTQLPSVLNAGGFKDISSVPGYTSTFKETIGQFGAFFASETVTGPALERGWATKSELEEIRSAIEGFGSDPRSLWGLAHIAALGWKP
jgi:SAM-dependent methyltransferase